MSSRFSPVRSTQRWPAWIDIPTARLPCNFDSVRGKEVFLVQPTSPPVNDHLVGLLALADACSRAVNGFWPTVRSANCIEKTAEAASHGRMRHEAGTH